MQVTGTRQREAWLKAELPPVERVAGGVWSVPVPIPDNPLRYVLSYLIEHDAGFLLVDPGWNHPDSWRALTAGLAACEIPLAAVTGVLVTHVHPDHHGQSGVVREHSGAWVGMHPREDAFLELRGDRGMMRDGMQMYLRWCGAPDSHLSELTASRPHQGQSAPMIRADRLIEHDELIDAPGLRLRAVWTPGHTPGHLCFYDEGRDLLLTGDHILPRITPNVSSYDMSSNPLDDYLASLAKLKGLQPGEVLPAHEYRFADLDSRLDDLTEHHQERLTETEDILAAAAGLTAWQVATGVTWSRAWSDLASFQRQAAVGEVLSHLRQLQARGLAAESDVDGVGMWTARAA
jgi:glyoxylase-like metal-dependent hydrolase (beta-lactamase superfamily II)